MRRGDREICNREEILKVIAACDVCRLAISTDTVPYILPLNFGEEVIGDQLVLYFHGAKQGAKYAWLARNNQVSFEMDCSHRLILDQKSGNCTMEYRSVIGSGRITPVPEEEKEHALRVLMRHYREEDFPFNHSVIPRTAVFALTVEEMTGKARIKR